jgi:hypothetical protein
MTNSDVRFFYNLRLEIATNLMQHEPEVRQ